MLGFLIPILITIYVYRSAKETNRNAVLWSVINLAVIFGVQIFIGLTSGIILSIGSEFYGWEESLLEKWNFPIGILALVVSLICSYFFVVRAVTQVPDEEFNVQSPPPPPQFS